MKRLFIVALLALAAGAAIAEDIRCALSWTYDKSGRKRVLQHQNYVTNVTGNAVIENVQKCYATNAALVLGSVTNAGFFYAKNLSSNTFVEIGTTSGTNFIPFLRLDEGMATITWLATIAPRAKIDPGGLNGQVELDYMILDK
jgi:hypothetical protein